MTYTIDSIDPNEGEITEIKETTFWGVFGDGTTFDIPNSVLDGHGIGTKVLRNSHEVDEFDDPSDHYDQSFMLVGADYATIILCNVTEEGFEIGNVFRLTKEQFLKDEGLLN